MMDLGDGHASVHVLLVRQDDQYRAGQLLLTQHVQQLVLGDANAVPVRRVHHIDDCVRVAVVATPIRSIMEIARIEIRITILKGQIDICT